MSGREWAALVGLSSWSGSETAIPFLSKLKRVMTRVASLYLPHLAIERIRRSERVGRLEPSIEP